MKSCFYLSLILLVLLHASSCATRRTPVVTLRSVRTDTLQLYTLHYDSVFIRQEHYQDRSQDTVYLHDRTVEYRYRLLRDTVYRVKIDSIPVIREVEVVKVERHVPAIYRLSLSIVIILTLSLIIYIVWKIRI